MARYPEMELTCTCGHSWLTTAAPGTGVRCPKCRKNKRVPAGRPRTSQEAAAVRLEKQDDSQGDGHPGAWNPPSVPYGVTPAAAACPGCESDRPDKVMASPLGTTLVCMECVWPVTPASVISPYEGADNGAALDIRHVKSQRETDLEAIEMAQAKGAILGHLDQLASDARLHPDSRPVVEWFAEQVKAATGRGRLDELIALLPTSIKKRHWWQSGPPALDPAASDEDQDQDYDDDEPSGTVLALPADAVIKVPQRATWAEALDAIGARLTGRDDTGACQIVANGTRCRMPIGGHPPVTNRIGADGWTCSGHYYELGRTISAINKQRGLA